MYSKPVTFESPRPASQKVAFYKYFYVLAAFACLVAGVIDYQEGYLVASLAEFIAALFSLAMLYYIYRFQLTRWLIHLSAFMTFMVFSIAAITQMDIVYSLVWIPIFPIVYFFLTDYRQGLIWTALSALVFIASYLMHPVLITESVIPFDAFIQSLNAFIFTTALAFFYERIRFSHERLLLKKADYDFLTGVNNRRSLSYLMEFEITQAKRYQKKLSFLLIDVDNFKQVNDNYGHKAGDLLLQSLALLARDAIRRSDVLARWGGEEFAILMPETEISNAEVLAEKLRKQIQNHQFLTVGNITVSIGVSELRVNDNMDDLVQRADKALYKAKADNKNNVKLMR